MKADESPVHQVATTSTSRTATQIHPGSPRTRAATSAKSQAENEKLKSASHDPMRILRFAKFVGDGGSVH